MTILRAVKGMNDVLPEEIPGWRRVEEAFWRAARRYRFGEVRTPIVEPTELFVRSIGEVTDIVEKEMYTWDDRGRDRADGGVSLTLRPEGTAGAVRAYLEHSRAGREPLTRWAYLGPMFRRERPARGRLRQFWQAGAEIYGEPGPHVDAELIQMVVGLLRELGVEDLEVLVNSLGSGETRARYSAALVEYLTPHAASLSADSQRRLRENPLRVIDSKSPQDQEIARGAPTLLEHIGAEDRAHFDELLATLEALGTPHRVEPTLVRGLDYYTRTLFEVRGRGGDLGAQNTLCGGGRYDGLVEALGGASTPAIGFAMGLERLLLVMPKDAGADAADVFVVAATPETRRPVCVLLEELRAAGFSAEADLRGGSVKSQFRRADRSGARAAIVVGPDELARGVVQVKDLAASSQAEVARGDVVPHVRRMAEREPTA